MSAEIVILSDHFDICEICKATIRKPIGSPETLHLDGKLVHVECFVKDIQKRACLASEVFDV